MYKTTFNQIGINKTAMEETYSMLEKYAPVLGALTAVHPFSPELLIEEKDHYSAYYSPFDFLNSQAKLVIVGISPGLTQADMANLCAKQELNNQTCLSQVAKLAKETASFGGTLRTNLIAMLDYAGINRYLKIPSCESLFGKDCHLLHSTSVFRYPTLMNGKPISSAKGGLAEPFLKSMFEDYFVQECLEFNSQVLYFPLGTGVSELLGSLTDRGILDKQQVIDGFPHPSGTNAERVAYFLGRKDRSDLSTKTNPESIDSRKRMLLEKLARLGVLVSADAAPNSAQTKQPENKNTRAVAPAKTKVSSHPAILANTSSTSGTSNLLSPTTKFISGKAEKELNEALAKIGYTISSPKSAKTKEVCVFKGENVLAYISRKTGLSKGQAVVTVHPRNAIKLDKLIGEMEGVTIRMGKESRFISSSNYSGFNSKGYNKDIDTNEHIAAPYSVDVGSSWNKVLNLIEQI
jgi:hypothetical protein